MHEENHQFVFRQWNPSKLKVSLGSDNSEGQENVCPIIIFFWYIIEILFFK
jgi:hypothetical protein